MNDQADDLVDGAGFAEALVYGPAAPLSLYRRAYTAVGIPWPGDEQVLARHRVIDEPEDNTAVPLASVVQLSWPATGTSPDQAAGQDPPAEPDEAVPHQWATVARLAAAFGWEADAAYEAAQAEALRSYGLDTVAYREAAAVRELFRAAGRAPSEAELVKVAQIEALADQAARERVRQRLVEERARWRTAQWQRRRVLLGLPARPERGKPTTASIGCLADAFVAMVADTLEHELATQPATPGALAGEVRERVRQTREQVRQLHNQVEQTRQDVAWLRRAVAALLDHHQISLTGAGEDPDQAASGG